MNNRAVISTVILWTAAAAPLGQPVRALAAFAAVALVPGLLIDRAWADRAIHAFERPARAFALSVACVSAISVICGTLGLSMRAVLGVLALLSLGLAARSRARLDASSSSAVTTDDGDAEPRAFAVWAVALIVLTFAAVALAAVSDNIARDRMWYLAYVTRLASGDAIDWTDPMLATGRVVWRFAYNGWIASLGAWTVLAGGDGPWLFQRIAPLLLAALSPSAAFVLARAVFRRADHALLASLTSVVVLAATRYPFFSPERYSFVARLVEDKFVALLLVMPVALGVGVDLLCRSRTRRSQWLVLTGALAAVAFTHALVYLLAALALAPFAAWAAFRDRNLMQRALAVLAVVTVITIAPAWIGLQARADIARTGDDGAAAMLADAPAHPVVRSHLRMQRLRELAAGGPIVDPTLLYEPLLLLSLGGLAIALRERRSVHGAYLLLASIPALALAFVPGLAPAFGRAVVPWMAYRALWAVPFGLLLAVVLIRAVERMSTAAHRNVARVAVAVALLTLAASRLPWGRLAQVGSVSRLAAGEETLALLARLAKLPAGSHIAAAPGIAELIPAYSGRSVLAFADRGTVVFAGSHEVATERLRANAAIVGLARAAPGARRQLIAAFGVTHTVAAASTCDPPSESVYQEGGFTVCAWPASRADLGAQPNVLLRGSTAATAGRDGSVRAALGESIRCRPAGRHQRQSDTWRWRRASRWSARALTIDCRVRFDHAVGVHSIRVAARLPYAREALLYAWRAVARDGRVRHGLGAVELIGRDSTATGLLDAGEVVDLRIRLAPAYLPYLNLNGLELRG